MADSGFRLLDKTLVLSGPFESISQNLTSKLTELGTDVSLLTDRQDEAQRFCQNILDMREVNDRFGRAAAIPMNASSDETISNMFRQSSELFVNATVSEPAPPW